MKRTNTKTIALVILLAAAIVVSAFGIAPRASSVENHAEEILYLNNKKNDVLSLTTLTTAASVFITMAPDDTATPIAEQLAELSDYFIIILVALYIEKFLLTVLGSVSFGIILPVAFALLIVFLITKNFTFRNIGVKLAIFGVAAYLMVPAGLALSRSVEESNALSIQETMTEARKTVDDIIAAEQESDDSSGIVRFFHRIGSTVTSATTYAKAMFNNAIDAVAIHFVTSLAIPALVALAFIPLTKLIIGIDIQPKAVEIAEKMKRGRRHSPKLSEKTGEE